MNKKIGKSIFIGIIILTMIFSLAGILYTTFNSITYAAENNDFYLYNSDTNEKITTATVELSNISCNESGEVKSLAKIKIPNNATINNIEAYINGNKLEQAKKSIITTKENYKNETVRVFSGENYDIELKYSKSSDPICYVIGKKIGANETITFKLSYNNKEYETSLKVNVVDADFRFALDGNRIKEYTGKYAFEIGEEAGFQLKLPNGYTIDDVIFSAINNNGYIEINNEKKTVTGKKEGVGRLVILLKENNVTKVVSYTNFEVVKEVNLNSEEEKSNATDTSTPTKKNDDKYSGEKSIKFSSAKRIITLSGEGGVKIYETPTTSGINKADITYSVSDTSIATVEKGNNSAKVIVNIKKSGTFTLTATYEKDKSIKAEKEIVVYKNTLDIFEKGKNKKINNENISLNIGEEFSLSAFEDSKEIDTNNLKYTSSNEKVCTVDESGKIKAIKKGNSTVKVILNQNSKTYAKVYVKVTATAEEQMAAQIFSFPKDENGKVIEAKGENALIIGKTYSYNLIKPEGTENYEVTYTCTKSDLLEINGDKITPLKAGKGNLIAKMKIGNVTKTATMSFEIFASDAEKNQGVAETSKYFNIEFQNESMVVEKDNVTTLKPIINTNMKKSDYNLNWSSSNEDVVTVDKNGRITAKAVGTSTITVSLSSNDTNKAIIKVEVKEKVVLVSSLRFNTNLEKNGSTYLIKTNESVEMSFDVKPENATLKDYSIEVEDKENFIVQGKTIVALKEGIKTKLTARSLDSGNKVATIILQSVLSSEELSNLQLITDNKEITIQVGETLKFKKPEKSSISKSGNISYKTDNNEVISITGNKIGTGEIRIKQNNEIIATIPVNIVAPATQKDDVAVKSIELPIDQSTSQTKNYTTDYPLVVDKCYNIVDTLAIYPVNATNKEVNVEVSDKSAFSVTSEGNIIANKANATAVVTLSSVSNSDVKTTFKVASTEAKIKSIKFAKNYVGEHNLTLDEEWGFNLIISLDNGNTLDPTTMSNPNNNAEYQKYLKQIVIESSDTSLVEINSSMHAKVVVGKNGTGTLTAYVKSDPSIKATAKFESVGINSDTKIKSAKFAESTYSITFEEGETEFCPIITLSNNYVYDPSKDYGSKNSVANSDDYRNYIEQLKIDVAISSDLVDAVKINTKDKTKLSVIPNKAGTCQLVLKLRSTGEELCRTIVVVKKSTASSSSSSSSSNVTGTVTEIDHSTTSSNKNLKITDIKFVDRSYVLDGNYATAFKPTIKLSDGSTINHKSKDQETYLYYVSQTELFFANETDNAIIDFGLAEIVNSKCPSQVIPLKNGKFNLAIGLKSSGAQTIYDMVPVTVKI